MEENSKNIKIAMPLHSWNRVVEMCNKLGIKHEQYQQCTKSGYLIMRLTGEMLKEKYKITAPDPKEFM